eukprot:scpid39914/ scgid0031/ Probable E3 ubiquitin-protein ligase HERC4; HECT domain and RCC1-like domain-containing protein 4
MSSTLGSSGRSGSKVAAPLPSAADDNAFDAASEAVRDAIAVFELMRGATLLKAVKNGKPHFRTFSLSKDLTRLTWVSPSKSAADASVLISQVSRIVRGQTTKVFESNPIPEYSHLSLSLLYDTKKSLDIVFSDQKMYDIWLHGLQALVDGFSDIKAVAEVAKRVGSTTQSENVKVKVAFDTLGQAKVSFTEEACDIYTWGRAQRSVLGHGDEKDQKVPEVLVPLLGRNVKLMALGKLHTIALIESDDEDGEIYSWGSGQYGRLGHGNLHDRFLPLRVAGDLSGVDIVHIACGEFHSAAVSDKGELFTWGRSSSEPCGRLGYDCPQRCFKPRLASSLAGITVSSVACGTHHTVVLTESNQLLSFGENEDGQLGLGHTKSVTAPQQIQFPAPVDVDPDAPVPGITKVACGTRHNAALFENGTVFTWGSNEFGQCGQGEPVKILAPQLVEAQHIEFDMADVACGDAHSAFVTCGGLVFTCGDNTDSQLGLGHCHCKPEHRVPQPFSIAGIKVVQVSCAYRATAALSDQGKLYTCFEFRVCTTDQGKLYTWGCNNNGLLGHGDLRPRAQATEVQAVCDKQVRSVFCGAEHMAITVMRSWVPDDEAKQCMMCKKKFTTVRRRHHCRQCGGIFCGACTTKRFPLLDKGYNEPQRVCDKCHAFLSQKQSK